MLHYRTRIPIIGSNPKSLLNQALRGNVTTQDYRRLATNWEQRTRNAALIKPGRRLGGAWIDQFVSQRRAVSLCSDCESRYGQDLISRHEYHKRDGQELSDCDGCGDFRRTSVFYSAIA